MGEKRQTKNWLLTPWFLGGAVVVFIFLAIGFGRAWYEQKQIRDAIASLEQEAARLESKKIKTLEALKFSESDDFIEAKARLDLDLVKPGEQTAIITPRAEPSNAAASRQSGQNMVNSADHKSNLYLWWQYFFK